MRKGILFSLANLLLWSGFGSGFFAIHSLFVVHVGATRLFPVYLAESILALLLAGSLYFFVDLVRKRIFFLLLFPILGGLVLLSWAGLQGPLLSPSGLFVVRVLSVAVFAASDLTFWLCAGSCFTTFEAKRWFPVLSASGMAGGLLGGAALYFLVSQVHTVNFPIVWGAVLIVASVLLGAGLKRPTSSQATVSSSGPKTSFQIAPVAASRLAQLLLLFWIFYIFVSRGTDFLFNAYAREAIGSLDGLTAFFGLVTAFSSGAIFFYHLLFRRWLRERLAVDKSLLLMMALIGFALLFFAIRPSLITAALAQGIVFYFVADWAVCRLATTLTLYPEKMRGSVRLFTEGLGRVMGALLLLFATTAIGFSTSLAATARGIAGIAFLFCFSYPLIFRHSFFRHLLNCLESTDRGVVANAIRSLDERGGSRAARPLLALLRQSRGWDLRRTIIITLGKMRSREAIPEIIQTLSSEKEGIQMAALEALKEADDSESLPALLRILKSAHSVSFQVRTNAAQLLGRLLKREAVPFLLPYLYDGEDRTVANVIEALGLLKDPKSIPALLRFLEHPNNRTAANAIVALFQFRRCRRAARDAAGRLFRSSDPARRLSGLYAVGMLGLRKYRSDLARIAHDRDSNRQEVELAATGLARMKDRRFCDPLITLLLDDDTEAAIRTAKRLQYIPPVGRRLLFEAISRRSETEQAILEYRLNETQLDFTEERRLSQPIEAFGSGSFGTSRFVFQ